MTTSASLRRAVSGLGALVWLAIATTAHASPLTPHTPIDVSDESLRTLGFAQLVLRAEKMDDVGVAKDTYVLAILEALRERGYPAVGGEDLVFGKDDSHRADVLLGGTLSDIACNGTFELTCGIEIKWQVLDQAQDQILYEVETRHEEDGLPQHFDQKSANTLILGALHSLLSRPKFVAALRKGDAEASIPDNGYTPAGFKACEAPAISMPQQSEEALSATALVQGGNATGSGVFISPDGLLLTAAHVVGGSPLSVTLRDGGKRDARILRIDRAHDVALLKVQGGETPCLQLQPVDAPAGADVFAIGSPGGEELSFSMSRGIVSGVREMDGVRFLQTDASINPGNSGGPLVDTQGAVLAIVSWKVAGGGFEGLGFGVPVAAVLEALKLQPGAATDATLTQGGPQAVAEASSDKVVDSPDPAWATVKPVEAPLSKPWYVYVMRTTGFLAALVGGPSAVISYATYDGDTATKADYDDAVSQNDLGWILLGSGVALYTLSYFVGDSDEEEEKKRGETAGIEASIGIGSVQLKGSF